MIQEQVQGFLQITQRQPHHIQIQRFVQHNLLRTLIPRQHSPCALFVTTPQFGHPQIGNVTMTRLDCTLERARPLLFRRLLSTPAFVRSFAPALVAVEPKMRIQFLRQSPFQRRFYSHQRLLSQPTFKRFVKLALKTTAPDPLNLARYLRYSRHLTTSFRQLGPTIAPNCENFKTLTNLQSRLSHSL